MQYYGILFANKQRFTLYANTPQEAIQKVAKELGYHVDEIIATKQGFNVVVYLLNGERKSTNSYIVRASKASDKVQAQKLLFRKSTSSKIPTSFDGVKRVKNTLVENKKEQSLRRRSYNNLTQDVEVCISAEITKGTIASMNVTETDIKAAMESAFEGTCTVHEYKPALTSPCWELTLELSWKIKIIEGYPATRWEPAEPAELDGYIELTEVEQTVINTLNSLGLHIDKDSADIDISGETEDDIFEFAAEDEYKARESYYADRDDD